MIYNKEERDAQLQGMQKASDLFYGMAIRVGCHNFIEFTGLMNEYIKMCEKANDAGIDFNECNVHTGGALPMAPHNLVYLREKLECIYGPSVAKFAELPGVSSR